MIYQRPTYPELTTRITADLAAMPAVLREPLAKAWARACHGEYGFLEWISLQSSPLTCDLERLYDWATLYTVPQLSATFATGYAVANGNVNTQVLAQTIFRGTNGLDYALQSTVILSADPTPISIKCLTAGVAGNLVTGQILTLVDPVLGLNSSITVQSPGITGGADIELVDDWRIRVADEWQVITTRGARSGKPDDYRFWAKSAHPSVTGALVQPHLVGAGTVVVRPICNGLVDRMPTQAVLDAVANYLLPIAPATADFRVAAPIKRAITFNLHLFPDFDDAEKRQAILQSLSALILTEETEASYLALAEIDASISTVTTQYTRILPNADIATATSEILVFGGMVWS